MGAMHAVLMGVMAFACSGCEHSSRERGDAIITANHRFLNGMLAFEYERACEARAAGDEGVFRDLDTRSWDSGQLLLAAKIASDGGLHDLIPECIEALRLQWEYTPVRCDDGVVRNRMIGFGKNDWVEMNGRLRAARRDQDGESIHRFEMRTIRANVRYGREIDDVRISGSVAIERATESDEHGMTHGKVTAFDGSAVAMGQEIVFALDPAFEFSEIKVDGAGNGRLGVVVKVTSPSRALAGFVEIGGTFYLSLPIEVSGDWSEARIRLDRTISGDQFMPTMAAVLEGADGDMGLAKIADRPCMDQNANGVLDGAEEQIRVFEAVWGRSSRH
jgi:hypothetical protein